MELKTDVTVSMFKKAFEFGSDYCSNPAKVLKDRTAEKNRGLGEILTANLYGKIIELGVCKILSDYANTDKKFFPDFHVRSEFDYGTPDITKVKESGKNRAPKKFVEIKYSPENFEWIGLYTTQFESMKEYVKEVLKKTKETDHIIVIWANIRNKKSGKNFTVSEQKVIEVEKKKLEQLKKIRQDQTIFPRTISRNTRPSGVSLNDAREELRERKKIADKEISTQESYIKNLEYTMPKRKDDLLGVYFKQRKFYLDKFNYFSGISDFEVVIDYVLEGRELEDKGKDFLKGEIFPSSEIFQIPGCTPYDDEGKLRSTPTTKYKKIHPITIGNKKLIPTDLVNTEYDFPSQFGKIYCDGKVELIKEKKSTKTTVFIKCLSDIILHGEFLGRWEFKKDQILRIVVKNKLGSKMKGVSDKLFPKRLADSIFSENEKIKRLRRIAKAI